jgi:hypothetical protein
MDVEILEDGTVKVLTGSISPANHMQAESFMRALASACGGEQIRRHVKGVLGEIKHRLDHMIGHGHSH